MSESPIREERLVFDPLYTHAQEAAEDMIYAGYDQAHTIDHCKEHLSRYASVGHRQKFLDAFRKELTISIENHRLTCTYIEDSSRCPHEHTYAYAIACVVDTLDAINPAIARRDESLSFNKAEADEVGRLLVRLLAATSTMHADLNLLKAGQQVLYEDLTEFYDDLHAKTAYGKRDWFDLIKARVSEVFGTEVIKDSVVRPIWTDLARIAGIEIDG